MKVRAVTALLCCFAFLSFSLPAASAAVDGKLLADEADGENWASFGRTYSENHYSPLDEISTANIGRLGLAWSADLEVRQRADSQPLAVDGVIYVAAGLSIVQAFDALTGKRLWRYDPNVAAVTGIKLRPSWGIRGLALWQGRVYAAAQDGRLFALDARTGELLWSQQAIDKKMDMLGGATITGAPRIFNGKVVIGSAGAEWWARGALSCFDAATGKFLWRFYTVPGNPKDGFENEAMRMAARTWSGEWWRYGGGGTVWNAITYDPDFNRLYLGVGNGGPWNWKIRNPDGGDALFLGSIVALDADTGDYVWHYQQNPNEAWDYGAAMDILLAEIPVRGKPRKVLMQAPKNGFFYVIDREQGKLISAEKYDKVTWAERIDLRSGRPVESPGARYDKAPVVLFPGIYGAHSVQPTSYSPRTGLVYIPTIRAADIYSTEGIDARSWRPRPGVVNTGMSGEVSKGLVLPVEEFGSFLQAWDPQRQKAVWKVATPTITNGGTMAVAGGLVFQGHIDGTFNAYDASNGTKVWSFDAKVPVLGAPISYAVNGRQYITVLSAPSGMVHPSAAKFGWQYREHPRRVLTFVLDGQAKLPPTPAARVSRPLPSTQFRSDPQIARQGAVLYAERCIDCHGPGAVATGAAPDLRESPLVLDRTAFMAIVRNGVLRHRGMPQFEELPQADVDAIRHYIRSEAEGGLATGEPAGGRR